MAQVIQQAMIANQMGARRSPPGKGSQTPPGKNAGPMLQRRVPPTAPPQKNPFGRAANVPPSQPRPIARPTPRGKNAPSRTMVAPPSKRTGGRFF